MEYRGFYIEFNRGGYGMTIPEAAYNEIDFMLGSIEECNLFLSPILKKHGIDPAGSWLDIKDVPEEVIEEIYNKFFKEA